MSTPRAAAQGDVPTPREAALALALELAGLGAAELLVVAGIAMLAGVVRIDALIVVLAIALGAAIARVTFAAAFIVRQRILHRAARADRDASVVPSPRVIDLARRAPRLVAWLAPPLVIVAGFVVQLEPRAIALLAAVTLLALTPVETRARVTLDRWIGRLPEDELPDRPLGVELVGRAGRACAPPLGVALVGLAIASEGSLPWVALALLPAVAAAALATREVLETRRELDQVAARVGAIELGAHDAPAVPALSTPGARQIWESIAVIVDAASETVRSEADAQRAIEREEQVRSRFMAAMGHELRSPLNSIVGFAQLLEDGTDGPLATAQIESVVLIRRSAQDLLRLLTDILDSARLDAERLRLKKAWTPSVEIVTEAVRLGRSIVDGQAIEIESEIQPGMPPVLVDRERIVQAVVATFRHAVRNARGGTIEVRARIGVDRGSRSALLIEVRDESRTLAPEELERVFDSFRDLRDATTGRRIGGLGLALALSRRLVRLHGGDVWADGSPRGGTRYVVALPLEPQ